MYYLCDHLDAESFHKNGKIYHVTDKWGNDCFVCVKCQFIFGYKKPSLLERVKFFFGIANNNNKEKMTDKAKNERC